MDGPIPRRFGLLPAALAGGLLAAVTFAGGAGAAGLTAPPSGGSGGTATQGAFGTVAAVAGTSMEVQNQGTGQVTVNWTSSTAFTQEATVSASSVAAGDCVTATGSSSKGKITAQAVSISAPASSGNCGGGPSRSGVAPARISGGPPGGSQQVVAPPGGPAVSGSGALGIAGGKVLSVSGSRLVLSGFSSTAARKTGGPKTGGDKGSGKDPTKTVRSGKRPGSGKPQVVSVTLSSATTYTETQPAAASDLAVGDCVAANGPAAGNGSVAAKAVQITGTGGKSCTAVPAGGRVNSEQISG